VNAKTARVVFKKPYAGWKDLFSSLIPAHKVAGQNFNNLWANSIDIASGPFMFDRWQKGSQLVLKRNPQYRTPSKINQIVFRFIPDTNTQFQAMRGGEVNIIHPQPQQQIVDIKKQSNIRVQQGSQFSWEHMDLQTGPGGHPALKRKFVRQAIVTAVNRLQMRQVLYKDIAPNLPALNNTIYKNFQPEYIAHKFQPFGFSQKKAIQLLRSNGCTGGPATPNRNNRDIYSCPGVGKLEFDFHSTTGNQQRELAFQIMQAQLRSVGIQLNSKFSLTALTVTLPTKKWDIMLFAWVGSPEPAASVNIWRCGGAQNYNGYCSRPASRLLLKSNEEFDPKKRTKLLNDADALIAQHAVTLPLYARPTFLIHDSRLRGALLNPTQTGPTWNSGEWSFAR
jgi:peptide/nickel transport system substrate-binding protein